MTRTVLCALRVTPEFDLRLPHLEEALAIRAQTAAAQLARPPTAISDGRDVGVLAVALGGGLRAGARRSGLGHPRLVSRCPSWTWRGPGETRWRPRRPGDLRFAWLAPPRTRPLTRDTCDFGGSARR
jgi:hypothetical protein